MDCDDRLRLQRMSDSDVATVWKSIWALEIHDRPSDDWISLVYSEMSKRGLKTT